MYGNYDVILEKIVKESGISKEDIEKKIQEKQDELSGLVSPEGAAHIVAKELGIELLKKTNSDKKLEIKNIVSGMRNVTFEARVTGTSPVREFNKKDGGKGQVQNAFLADESGSIRVTLWNEEVEKYDLEKGDAVKVIGAYVVEDNRENPEIRIGRGSLTKVESDLPDADELRPQTTGFASSAPVRTTIEKLEENENSEFRAAVVQLFESDPFYPVCPECNKSLGKNGDGKCQEHGEVEPKFGIVLSAILDDGTGNIRAVFFREAAEKILGMSIDEALTVADKFRDNTVPVKRASDKILGKEFYFTGRPRTNKMFNRLEIIVNSINDVDPVEETNNILNRMEA